MKRKFLMIYAIILVLINSVQVNASSYADEWLAKKQAQQEKYLAELEKDGNLTQEAIDATKTSKKKVSTNKKETKKSKNNDDYTLIYGTDELHVVGLPTDERGYTKAGKYEK